MLFIGIREGCAVLGFQEAIDGALKQLKEDGTLSELAIKWVGYDVTEEE